MTKTAQEWQALAGRIARELMGYVEWDDLPITAQTAFLAIMPRKPDPHRLDRLRRSWWSVARNACAVMEAFIDWQPHKDVAQAMMALRTLLVKSGRHVTADLFMRPLPGCCRVIIHEWTRALEILGPREDNLVEAICGAIEQWLAREKEATDASTE